MGIICCLLATTDKEILPYFLNAEGFIEFRKNIPEERRLDLDKSWHGIHFLLSSCEEGKSQLGSFLLSGGHRIPVRVEWPAPTRAFLSSEVKEIAGFLSTITTEGLLKYYQPKIMTQLNIYPMIWGELDEDRSFIDDYLLANSSFLKEFVLQAASQNLRWLLLTGNTQR
jgi:hypothetical protein